MPETTTQKQGVEHLINDCIALARTKRGKARAQAFALLSKTFDRIERRQLAAKVGR